jgi:predicted nucleotidyltransferase
MRLSLQEKEAILIAINKIDPTAKVFLFGSRTNDTQKGGDIDLLIISDTINFSTKLDILTEIKIKIGDQKIDLILKKNTDLENDPFVNSILPQAIQLNHDLFI